MSDWQQLPPEWHGGTLPPGTPAPFSEPVMVTCRACESQITVTKTSELGSVYLDPEECPACGEPFSDDILDTAQAPERDWDMEREREWERAIDEEDARDERNYHYPDDMPREE